MPVAALFSTLGRTAARGIETMLVARWVKEFYAQLMDHVKRGETRTSETAKWEPATWPTNAKGVGMSEAPRGALAHWIEIKDQKIDNYQLVVPTTWNASPRDAQGQRSAFEASLIGTPVADIEQPLEILRTIHSFDPCLACAVHFYDPHGRHVHHLDTLPGRGDHGHHYNGARHLRTGLHLGAAGPALSLGDRGQHADADRDRTRRRAGRRPS